MGDRTTPGAIDTYLAGFPPGVQAALRQVRAAIKKAAPFAAEKISYGIPTFAQNGNLVHFAAWKSHVGFYPGASAIKHFSKELAGYKGAKGSVQFPLSKPMPVTLITKIVKFRVAENAAKGAQHPPRSPGKPPQPRSV